MPTCSFESVLRQLGARRTRDCGPHQATEAAGALFLDARLACELQDSERGNSRAGRIWLDAYLSHGQPIESDGDTADNAIAQLGKLLAAAQLTLAALERNQSESAVQLHLRKEYARRYHPDKLPDCLKGTANRLMAEINARVVVRLAGKR